MSKPSVLRNTAVVGALTMLSRLLGLVREMLQSRLIGAGVEQSAFTLAFAIPNMSRKLFGEGALTAAFVPIFRGEIESVGLERAARLARSVMTMMLLALASLVAIGVAALVSVRPAFAADSRGRLTVTLVMVLLPYMLAICGAAFGMGVMNALGKFKAAGFMPALLNVVWIAALGGLALFPGLDVASRTIAVALAILAGGFIQMAYMFRCMARAGVSPLPLFSGWRSEKVVRVWRNTGIAALGAGAVQINYALDQVLAQLAAPWAAGVIGYAERLMDLPLGVVGVAFGTVLLPTFAGHFAKDDLGGAREALIASAKSMLFVMLPASAGLAILAPETVGVVYQGGSFDGVATARVARALAVYSLGLGFFGLQKSFVPWFQAQNDMRTPLRVSVATVVLNATLNILSLVMLPVEWRHVGFAASTVVCAAVGFGLLVAAASRRNGSLGLGVVARAVVKMAFAVLVMAVALLFVRPLVASLNPILALAILVATGAAAYLASSAVVFRGAVPLPNRLRGNRRRA